MNGGQKQSIIHFLIVSTRLKQARNEWVEVGASHMFTTFGKNNLPDFVDFGNELLHKTNIVKTHGVFHIMMVAIRSYSNLV